MIAALFIFWNFTLFTAAEPKLSPLQHSVRSVVQAILKRATENAGLAKNDPKKLSQDALACEYIRVAAGTAAGEPAQHRAAAFLIGVGIALDDSPLLRTNLLTRGVCAAVESEEEYKARKSALGEPTIRNRRDLCQHFVVSMALTAILGADAAEAAGVTKELLDMKGGSGFSFIDLAADFAGVELGRWILEDPARLPGVAKGFQLDHHFPDLKNLREGFNEAQFKKEFGSTSDPRYKNILEDIRTRIGKLEAYKN